MRRPRAGSFFLTQKEAEGLRDVRMRSKVTQPQIAQALGIGNGTNVLFLEQRRRRVTVEELTAYLERCGMTLSEFYAGEIPDFSTREGARTERDPDRKAPTPPASSPRPPATLAEDPQTPTRPKSIHLAIGPPKPAFIRGGAHISETLWHLLELVRDFSVGDLQEVIDTAQTLKTMRYEAQRMKRNHENAEV